MFTNDFLSIERNKNIFDDFIINNNIKSGDLFFWNSEYFFGASKIDISEINCDFVYSVDDKCIMIEPGEIITYITHSNCYENNQFLNMINVIFLKKNLFAIPILLNADQNIILSKKYIYNVLAPDLNKILIKPNC